MNAVEKEIREEIELPDPAVQPLVHPLDLPEARSSFRRGRLIGAFTSLPVAALLAALVGYLGHTVVGPIALFVALVVIGTVAGRCDIGRSWDFIPRKRQDRGRPLPQSWDLVSAGVLALVLGGALLVVVFRLDHDDVPVEVRAFTFGGAAVATLLVVADVVLGLLRRADRRRALAGLPGAVVVVAATVLAYARWFESSPGSANLLWGAATVSVVALAVGVARLWDRGRATA